MGGKPETPPLRLEWMKASDVADNPANWRRHPEKQAQALRRLLDDVGWAGALLYNERTGRLIDGHLRKASLEPDALVPVLVGSWTEAAERRILASLDPIADLAEPDRESIEALLAGLDGQGAECLAEILQALEAPPPEDWAEAVGKALPDRGSFQQMAFILADSQAAIVHAALSRAKKAGPFVDSPSDNSNGNALTRIAEAYK